jgi:pilus assembly protein CpaF
MTGEDLERLELWLVGRLSASLDNTLIKRTPEGAKLIAERGAAILKQAGLTLAPEDWATLQASVGDELMGYGPIESLLADDTITEVMVNGPKRVYIERKGHLTLSDVRFHDDAHVQRVIQNIVIPLGRRIDAKHPTVDARLPDGSRVNAIVPPAAVDGPSITIRKFSKNKLSVEDLIGFGSLTPEIAEFLRACVVSRLNIVVSGGTGSGKTTLLNVLSSFIPQTERIVTIEDSAELRLQQDHVVRLEAVPGDEDGSGRVAIRDLVKNSLRMRPDRIVVGEVRGGEALDMLQAMNTGHDGSLTTAHANTPRDVLSRLETMVLMAGFDLPIRAIRQQIAAAVDLVVQQSRIRDGSRKVVAVTEVQGMEGDIIVLQDIFSYRESGLDDVGILKGEFRAAGIRPKFTPRLEAAGFRLAPNVYQVDASANAIRMPTPAGKGR